MLLAALLAVAQPVQSPPPPTKPTSTSELGYLTAGELADRCSVAGAPADISYCFAYIAAVHDAMRAYEVWLGVKEFCAPVGVAQSELRRSFLTYVTAYPTNRSGQAASVIVVALKETYPCISGPQNGSSATSSAKPKKP
ncbi:Rap1a/Tai family immunity protein [Novosphingobium sp. RD2P27]|uniref:Rap1a/Tai family immunity protein n=1 Tax=Novosphingobium kalidii TaxID=3230299 RepID=A0ABV2D002_9SPHN